MVFYFWMVTTFVHLFSWIKHWTDRQNGCNEYQTGLVKLIDEMKQVNLAKGMWVRSLQVCKNNISYILEKQHSSGHLSYFSLVCLLILV